MAELHSDAVGQLIEWAGPESDKVLEDMEVRAEEEEFPTVGPEVDRAFAFCTRLLGTQSVLELGSGYGYSAYWIARIFPDDGTIILTERDCELLDDARTYFERGDLSKRAVFKHGDALDIAENCTDSFGLVVLDHDTADYITGFNTARELVDSGGAILIDNVAIYEEILTPDALLATLNGETPPNERTRLVAEFFKHLKNDARLRHIYFLSVRDWQSPTVLSRLPELTEIRRRVRYFSQPLSGQVHGTGQTTSMPGAFHRTVA